MSPYYLKCRKYTEIKNPKVVKTIKQKNNVFIKMCNVNGKKIKFVKDQEVRGLLCNLMATKVPILSDLPIINTLF